MVMRPATFAVRSCLAAYAAQGSLFIQGESLGENRKTKPPFAIFGIKRRARA